MTRQEVEALLRLLADMEREEMELIMRERREAGRLHYDWDAATMDIPQKRVRHLKKL
jgi:hypothetical protein